jgi:hypothetical protein
MGERRNLALGIRIAKVEERELLAGIASNGPWKGFIEKARDPKRHHDAWAYSLRTNVSPEVSEALKGGDKKRRIKNGTKVLLAEWEPGKDETARIFRIGYVDYIRRDGHFISLAMHLDEFQDREVPVPNDDILLRYVDGAEVTPAS